MYDQGHHFIRDHNVLELGYFGIFQYQIISITYIPLKYLGPHVNQDITLTSPCCSPRMVLLQFSLPGSKSTQKLDMAVGCIQSSWPLQDTF